MTLYWRWTPADLVPLQEPGLIGHEDPAGVRQVCEHVTAQVIPHRISVPAVRVSSRCISSGVSSPGLPGRPPGVLPLRCRQYPSRYFLARHRELACVNRPRSGGGSAGPVTDWTSVTAAACISSPRCHSARPSIRSTLSNICSAGNRGDEFRWPAVRFANAGVRSLGVSSVLAGAWHRCG